MDPDKKEAIDITKLIPEESSIEIYLKDKLHKFTLRPLDLRDESWLKRKFGNKLEAIFKNIEMESICSIIFRLIKDKSLLEAIQVDDYDDDGNKISITVTGPERVMRGIRGKAHQIEVFRGLIKTMGISRPILSALEKEENKKKAVLQKKNDQTLPIGA